jgi:hypothetical protein
LAPDLKGWLFYPHDGELQNGGVYVHHDDKSHIYLLVKGMLIRVDQAEAALAP